MYPQDYYKKSIGPVTMLNKLNPFWWLGNRDDPITLEKNSKRWPDDALWLRKLKWFFRNPAANFRRYVIGFWDKRDIWARQRPGNDDMWPLDGERLAICLPFISFHLWGFEGYLGWKPNGEFGGPCIRRSK
jgi:hypothetical protein